MAQVVPGQSDNVMAVIATAPSGKLNATPCGYEQITALSAAAALTVPTGACYCIIQAQDQAVRWRDDGTDPTATVGMRITTTEELFYDGDLSTIKFFEEAASAKLNVVYYK
jgi:hypothetical protein